MLNVGESFLLCDLIRVSLIKASPTSKRPGSQGPWLQVYSWWQDDPLPPAVAQSCPGPGCQGLGHQLSPPGPAPRYLFPIGVLHPIIQAPDHILLESGL